MLHEFEAAYSSQKGFYGKAYVHEVNDHIIDLYSYDTRTCTVNHATHTIMLRGAWDYSNTTLRHIREFLAQYCDEKFIRARKREFIAAARSGREIHGWPIVL